MHFFYHKLPFLLELFFNGLFILIFSLVKSKLDVPLVSLNQLEKLSIIFAELVPYTLVVVIALTFLIHRNLEDLFRRQIFSLIVIFPLFLIQGDLQFTYWLSSVHLFSSALNLFDHNKKKSELHETATSLIGRLNLSPAQVVLITFALIIMIGAFLLVLPISAAPGVTISFMDALFTSTSATCVTGLSTISLRDSFSVPGQIIVLILIQIGGLGIMTLSSSMTILMGKTLAMREQLMMQDLLEVNSLDDLLNMIIAIIKYTFMIELWGGIVLTLAFFSDGMEFGQAIYYGFYHSISAFCNAGFALFNNSLENYAVNPIVNLTVSALVIMGGLGFIALRDMKDMFINRRSFLNLTLHTKIVIIVNVALIVVGTLFIFFNEFLNSLVNYDLIDKLQIAFFQSVSARTAGFNTISLNNFHPHTIYVMTLFMFIGASPGSTGGGIKTTTFAILVQSIRSTLRGREHVEMFDRKIPQNLILRTISVIIISLIIISVFIFLILKIETDKSFLPLFFEVISAFATVGLSLGVTGSLTAMGKLTLIALMYVGRVGPLTMVLAIGQNRVVSADINYPDGRIMIG
jgi:trk system potassium uptake protein TrkH